MKDEEFGEILALANERGKVNGWAGRNPVTSIKGFLMRHMP